MCTARESTTKPDKISLTRRRLFQAAIGVGLAGVGGSTVGSAQNTGGELIWSQRTAPLTAPTVINGTIYIGSLWGAYALDAVSGDVKWQFDTATGGRQGAVFSAPVVADDTVYVARTIDGGYTSSRTEMLYALDRSTGVVQWRFEIDGASTGSPAVVDNTVFFTDTSGVRAIDAEDGTELWHTDINGSADSSPIVSEDTIYVGLGKTLYALAKSTGQIKWTYETGGTIESSPTATGETIYVGSTDGTVYAVAKQTGELDWSFETGRQIRSSPTVNDSRVFIGSDDGYLYAISTATGEQDWRVETGDRIESSPTVASETVYVGSHDGVIYAVAAPTGQQRWQYETDDTIRTSPLVVDGRVYIGSADDNLYAISTTHDASSSGSRAWFGTLGHHDQWAHAGQTIEHPRFRIETPELTVAMIGGVAAVLGLFPFVDPAVERTASRLRFSSSRSVTIRRYPGVGLGLLTLSLVISTAALTLLTTPGQYSSFHPSTTSLLYNGLTSGLSIEFAFAAAVIIGWMLLPTGIILDRHLLATNDETPPSVAYPVLAVLPLVLFIFDLLALLYSPRGLALLLPWIVGASFAPLLSLAYLVERYRRVESQYSLHQTVATITPGRIEPATFFLIFAGMIATSVSALLFGRTFSTTAWTGMGDILASAQFTLRTGILLTAYLIGPTVFAGGLASDIHAGFSARPSTPDRGPSDAFYVIPVSILIIFPLLDWAIYFISGSGIIPWITAVITTPAALGGYLLQRYRLSTGTGPPESLSELSGSTQRHSSVVKNQSSPTGDRPSSAGSATRERDGITADAVEIEQIQSAIETARSTLDDAERASDTGAYKRALARCDEAYDIANEARRQALAIGATDGSPSLYGEARELVDRAQALRVDIGQEKIDAESESVAETLETISEQLDAIESDVHNGELVQAFQTSAEIDNRLEKVDATARNRGFETRVAQLHDRYEQLCDQIATAFEQQRSEAIERHLTAAKNAMNSSDYDIALSASKTAIERAEQAAETAKQYGLACAETFSTLRTEAAQLRDEITQQRDAYETATERLDVIHDRLATVTELIDTADYDRAQETLTHVDSELETARATTTKWEFSELTAQVSQLQDWHDQLSDHLSETREAELAIPDTVPTLEPGSFSYGEIEFKEQIGQGGNADVYFGTVTDEEPHPVAIKQPTVAGHATFHADSTQQLLAEARTWQQIDAHDHIVTVYEYGQQPFPWIAMEYMDGGHLGPRVGQLSVEQALWTALAITRGVRHAHGRGVVHLDLKPQNILFRSVADAWDIPKVADWGLSKRLIDQPNTAQGLTPQYAAPEQFDEQYGATDKQTDIYQLGTVFYELFTGEPPFVGSTAEITHSVLHEQPTPPTDRADISDEVEHILLKTLTKEKSDRYDNIVYLRDDLDNALFGDT